MIFFIKKIPKIERFVDWTKFNLSIMISIKKGSSLRLTIIWILNYFESYRKFFGPLKFRNSDSRIQNQLKFLSNSDNYFSDKFSFVLVAEIAEIGTGLCVSFKVFKIEFRFFFPQKPVRSWYNYELLEFGEQCNSFELHKCN